MIIFWAWRWHLYAEEWWEPGKTAGSSSRLATKLKPKAYANMVRMAFYTRVENLRRKMVQMVLTTGTAQKKGRKSGIPTTLQETQSHREKKLITRNQ